MKPSRFAPEAVRTPFVEVKARARTNGPLEGTRLRWLELDVPATFPEPLPGQFIMVTPPGTASSGLTLARPFSIARAVKRDGGYTLGVLYAKVGRGTSAMARAGDSGWTVLGPLGRPFPTDGKGPCLLVAGGRGVAPLVFFAEWLEAHDRRAELLIGARTLADWPEPAAMRTSLSRTRVWAATEDGTKGHSGRVLDLLALEPALGDALASTGATLHACGPHGLLAAVGALGTAYGVPAFVSIEAHMACGTGICRSCVVPREKRGPKARKGQNAEYMIACLEGPVVPAECVDWARDRPTAAPYGELVAVEES